MTKHSGSLSFPLKLMGLNCVLVRKFSPNLSMNTCSSSSSPIPLPGLRVTSAVTDAENPTPAFTFPSTFLGALMEVALLYFDKVSFLKCVFIQQTYCLTGEVNQVFVRTEQPYGNSYNIYLRDLFEYRFHFWQGAFPSPCCAESPCQQLPVVGYTQLKGSPSWAEFGRAIRRGGEQAWEVWVGVSCLASLLLHPGIPGQGLLCPLSVWPPVMLW